MPIIVRFYIKHCIIGFTISAAFIAAILWFNVANLWHLISHSDIGLMALVVFWVLNGIVFAGVQTGVAVMLMTENNQDEDGPRGGTPAALVPLRQEAVAGRQGPL